MKQNFDTWDECLNLREIQVLRKFTDENLIQLKEVIKVKEKLYLIFEFVEVLSEKDIKDIIYQTTKGLSFMHKHGFFHRDLKPENLLCDPINKQIKICDFGLVREIRSRPPYTSYVSTRWYRAPEIMLKSRCYNSPVDIYALGCIMAELYLMAPLFSGNSEIDQLNKICSVLGTPDKNIWSDGYKLASQIGYNFPQFSPMNLSTLIPSASPEAIHLISEMLKFDPNKRPSAIQILNHPYFKNYKPDISMKLNENNKVAFEDNSGIEENSEILDEIEKCFEENKKNRRSNNLILKLIGSMRFERKYEKKTTVENLLSDIEKSLEIKEKKNDNFTNLLYKDEPKKIETNNKYNFSTMFPNESKLNINTLNNYSNTQQTIQQLHRNQINASSPLRNEKSFLNNTTDTSKPPSLFKDNNSGIFNNNNSGLFNINNNNNYVNVKEKYLNSDNFFVGNNSIGLELDYKSSTNKTKNTNFSDLDFDSIGRHKFT